MSYTSIAKISTSTTGTLCFLFIFMFHFSQLSAQNEIPDSLIIERIINIQNMLDQGKPAAKLWWNGWLYGYSAATVVQGTIFISSDKLKTRQDMALGAATTLVGAVGQLIMPMTPSSAPGKLALIPGDTHEDRNNKLKKAEELFEASALREKDGRSWKMHAVSSAVNLSSGLITWLGFDRTIQSGLINFAINEVITETQIWTQPTRAIKDYKNYCEKYKNGLPSSLYKPKAHLYVNAFYGGLALRLEF
jgi:hypothetical protein